MPVRHGFLIASLGLLAACDGFDPPAPSASTAPPSPSSSPAAIAEEALRLADAAKTAALTAAKSCIISVYAFDDAADDCPVPEADVKALEASAAALDAFVKKSAAGVPPDAKAFATVALAFSEWLVHGHKYKRTRGTLRLFQDVADAWNAYRPGAPIPVDPVDEYRAVGFGSKGYIMKPMKKTDGRVLWKSCYDGPCLWESHY